MYSEDASVIKERMIGNIDGDVDKSEGYLADQAASASSEEFSRQSASLDEILLRVFASSAAEHGFSEDLERRCREFWVIRKPGTYAKTNIELSGSDGTVIDQGVKAQTESGLIYVTSDPATILAGKATVSVVASDVGQAYNVPAGAINQLPVAIMGVSSVTNLQAATGGTEKESDKDLNARLELKAQRPPTGGSENDYKIWALEVSGVGDADVVPLWNGNGTVKVIIIDSNKAPASQSLVTQVFDHIESVRPVGPRVTVVSATAVSIGITGNIIKSAAWGSAQVIDNINRRIAEYVKSCAFNKTEISYALINQAILSAEGVLDINTLRVNGGTSNVAISKGQVATVGVVTLNVT